jgi:hypothetical protein
MMMGLNYTIVNENYDMSKNITFIHFSVIDALFEYTSAA